MLWQQQIPDSYNKLSEVEIAERIRARKHELADDLLILGHHYQRDDVIEHADLIGDSLKLSQLAATESKRRGTKYIVFCGVHFMAETADILTDDSVAVILPDLSAGCSMADMADDDDVKHAWESINQALEGDCNVRVIPITYVNSSAAIKAFVGKYGGACCTSSNAKEVFQWALNGGTKLRSENEQIKLLFLPDQHLGRNTAYSLGFLTEVEQAAGLGKSDTTIWDPKQVDGGLTKQQIQDASIILWSGYCSVHMHFTPEQVDQVRLDYESQGGVNIIVHPECPKQVVDKADDVGSTQYIIGQVKQAKPGSNWAIGTEVHLVNRLAKQAQKRGVNVRLLSDHLCLCVTMYRINTQHLLWALDNLSQKLLVNRIEVPHPVKRDALLAVERMMAHAGHSLTPPSCSKQLTNVLAAH